MRWFCILALLSGQVDAKKKKNKTALLGKYGENTLYMPRHYHIGSAHFDDYNGTQHVFLSNIAMVENKDCKAPKDTATAICLAGHARGFNYPEVQESITEAMKCLGTNVKVFLVLYQDVDRSVADLEKNTSNFPRDYAEFHANGDYPANISTPKKSCSSWKRHSDEFQSSAGQEKGRSKTAHYIENISYFTAGMQINYKMERCYSAVEAYEKNNSMRFDFIARVRPDTYWVGLPKELGRRMEEVKARQENMCFIPDGLSAPDLCDHFALCSREAAYSYLAKPTRDYANCQGDFKKQFGYTPTPRAVGGFWWNALGKDNVTLDLDMWYFALARHREGCMANGCWRFNKNFKTTLSDPATQHDMFKPCKHKLQDICRKYGNA